MSGVAPDMENTNEITHARILNRLFEESTKEFHTEINAPFGMTTYDTISGFAHDEFGEDFGDLLDKWGDRFRTNMVAKGRARAKEIIEGVKAELMREERELRDRMMGTLASR